MDLDGPPSRSIDVFTNGRISFFLIRDYYSIVSIGVYLGCVCVCVCVCIQWYVSVWKWSESVSCSAVSNSLWPCGLLPARLLCPWNSPSKNTAVGCHFLPAGDLPWPRGGTWVSCIARRFFTIWAIMEALCVCVCAHARANLLYIYIYLSIYMHIAQESKYFFAAILFHFFWI